MGPITTKTLLTLSSGHRSYGPWLWAIERLLASFLCNYGDCVVTHTGLVLKYTGFRKLQKEEQHQDELYWEVPAERKDE